MNRQSVEPVVDFLFEVGTLRKIVRSHRQRLLIDDLSDNIASHSFRVAIIGYCLAKLEQIDPQSVVMMCLFHDVPESRSGDMNWLQKRYVKVYEDEIIHDQLTPLGIADDAIATMSEYRQRLTLTANVAKDADLLDQVLLLREHAWGGNQEALLWLEGDYHRTLLKTESAKIVLTAIRERSPSAWTNGLSTHLNR